MNMPKVEINKFVKVYLKLLKFIPSSFIIYIYPTNFNINNVGKRITHDYKALSFIHFMSCLVCY